MSKQKASRGLGETLFCPKVSEGRVHYGMVTGAGNWLITLYPHTGSRERVSGTRLITSKSALWCTSSSKPPPCEGSITSQVALPAGDHVFRPTRLEECSLFNHNCILRQEGFWVSLQGMLVPLQCLFCEQSLEKIRQSFKLILPFLDF